MLDEATQLQAVCWLSTPSLVLKQKGRPKNDTSGRSLWRPFCCSWIEVYLGPSDVIVNDPGKTFMGGAFQANSDLRRISTRSVSLEVTYSMSIVEGYHQPLHPVQSIIMKEIPDSDIDDALEMAVKIINDSVGLDGLVPRLLVFGALPRLRLRADQLHPSTFHRAAAPQMETGSMSSHFAQRQVRDPMTRRDGLNVTEIDNWPVGAPALVYPSALDRCDGPFSLVHIDGESATILFPAPFGPTKFRTTIAKPLQVENVSPDRVVIPEKSDGSQIVPGPSPYMMLTAISDSNGIDLAM